MKPPRLEIMHLGRDAELRGRGACDRVRDAIGYSIDGVEPDPDRLASELELTESEAAAWREGYDAPGENADSMRAYAHAEGWNSWDLPAGFHMAGGGELMTNGGYMPKSHVDWNLVERDDPAMADLSAQLCDQHRRGAEARAAWRAGAAAQEEGRKPSANPFNPSSHCRDAWRDGVEGIDETDACRYDSMRRT